MNWISIGSDNGLSHVRCQSITNADLLFIGSLGTNFSKIWIKILWFSFKTGIHKMSSVCLIWSFGRYQSVGSHHCLSELAFPLSAGSCLNIKTVFPGTGVPVFKIRQSCHQKSHLLVPGKFTTLSYGNKARGHCNIQFLSQHLMQSWSIEIGNLNYHYPLKFDRCLSSSAPPPQWAMSNELISFFRKWSCLTTLCIYIFCRCHSVAPPWHQGTVAI